MARLCPLSLLYGLNEGRQTALVEVCVASPHSPTITEEPRHVF